MEEAISGKTISNKYGECYLSTAECSNFEKIDYDNLTALCGSKKLAILGIETLGLSFDKPIVLLGIAKVEQIRLCICQFLLQDPSHELGTLWAFLPYTGDPIPHL